MLENNLMEFLCMSDYDTTVLFKAISQKKRQFSLAKLYP